MKASVLYGVGDMRYEEVPKPQCDDDSVIVKVKASGICGSDPPRVLKNWKYDLPAIIGHEFSGEIVEIGSNVKGFEIGDRVAAIPFIPCNECYYCKSGLYSMCENHGMLGAKSYGGFAEYAKVPGTNLIKVYDMDFESAAMIEPLAVSLHGVLGLQPGVGDAVAVMGAGTIGQLVIQWLKIYGVEKIIAVDISEVKLGEAKALGADFCINAKECDPVEKINEITEGMGVDISIECAGSKITEEQCLLITKKRGKVGYLGIAYTDVLLREKAFENIFRRELTVQGFWNSYSAPFPGKEWTKSVEYVKNGKIKLKEMISHRYKLSEASKAFEMIGSRKEEYNKVMILTDENK
ncbi:galactitol-1-phosphate 5-dehydrogenase [Clostridium sp. KNHs214]|uniref:galactitol-1-phosphate 5-dehydrogenase n=1 Tax=Clostridium sp. KNHs214 TaxID=1540257 RepID=UPI000557DF46|nr:galactitol-1-phosphate 5-dehydrogenase [Clostridium sp. KNHs214]